MKYETRINAPETLKSYSLEKLVDLWETTAEAPFSLDLATVRGWLMDELEARNPDGFNAWLEQDAPEDADIRKFIFRFPVLRKDNAKVGQYYAAPGNSYQIVRRVYRISEDEAQETGCMYLDRVETTMADFALPGSDIYRRTH